MPTLVTVAQRVAVATALALSAAALPAWAQAPTNGAGADTSGASGDTSVPDVPSLKPDTPDWDTFHGQLSAQKYSPLDQINTNNVGQLKKAWSFHTGDVSDGKGKTPASVWSATPIFANNTIYVGTPFYRLIALNPATGKEKWRFDTHAPKKALTQPVLKNRGVAYWQAKNPVAGKPCQKIVYMGTVDAKLYAVDADTGKKCKNFADDGVLNVNQWNTTHDKWPLSLLQPPTVVGDHLILGWAGMDWAYETAPPGTVWSINARTGKKEWSFNALSPAMRQKSGTANVWTGMSVDKKLGLVYVPVSSPSPNYWGGNRTEKAPLATSTTALDIDTGKVVWSRQWVHHDVWDYDINAAPTLMNITVKGKKIPALVQSTKMGFLFAVNRKTGKDIWPIEERPVPQGDGSVKGEKLSPTQPFPTKPKPLLDQAKKPDIWKLANIVGAGQCSRLWNKLEYHGMYTPPTTKGEGAMTYPDSSGGVQWGGIAFDPQSQTAVVNVSHIVQYVKLYNRADYKKANTGSGNESGFSPQTGAPYGMRLKVARNWLGMPCWQPPFGELVAIDMHTGDVKWRRPVGASQQYGFFMPENWGSPTIGGPAVTAGGLIFIGASMDSKVRAYSLKTGKEMWSDQAEAPVVANPSVYKYKGREYVAFVSGGNTILKDQVGDQIVVYALPKKDDDESQ